MNILARKKLLYFLVPLVLLLSLWFLYPREVLPFYSAKSLKNVTAYSDQFDGGNSKARLLSVANDIVFEAEIGNTLQFPYSGVQIHENDSSTIDITRFNELHVSLHAVHSRRIPISLMIKNYELKNGEVTTLIMTTLLRYEKDKTDYIIPLEKFEIPTWWFLKNHVDETEIETVDMSKFFSLDLQADQLLNPGTTDVITLSKVTFKNNPNKGLLIVSIVVVSLTVLSLIIYLFRSKYRVKIVPVPYLGQKVENLSGSDLDKIQYYVSHNYHLPITTQMVQMETGIPKSKIPTLLKEELNTTLKKLLTSIRVNEAKRLLVECDLPINEIADQVGFGHVSHFNRVFKDAENCTPNEFRNNEQRLGA